MFFKPVELLGQIISIYINLSQQENFCTSVVRDDRSFKLEYLYKSHRLLKKHRAEVNINELEIFIQKLPQIKERETEDLEFFIDAPEDFICPISAEVMRDPVYLPSSGKTCDKPTMKRILLNDEQDPFNRSPLTIEQLQPDETLRKRIETWIA